jgi:acyl-CoA thioester hydrolase
MIQPAQIQVRFSDLDVLGHVNNTVYFSYFEMTRVHYFRELLGIDWDWQSYGIILVKNEIEYKHSVLLNDRPSIAMITEQIGEKSFVLRYELMVNDVLYAVGRSVQVCFDAHTQKTISIPAEMREMLKRIEE